MKIKNLSIFAIICSLLFSSVEAKADKTLTQTGDILQVAIPVAGFARATYLKDYEGQKEFMYTLFANIVITHGLKYSTKGSKIDKRPNGKSGSFPSGHTNSAFQGAFFLNTRYGYSYGIPAIGLAALTGYSRVDAKQHHVHDVLAGAAIAFAVNYFLVKEYEDRALTVHASKDSFSLQLKMDL